MAFHVFVDGVRVSGPNAVARLAAGMAGRYGLLAEDIAARIGAGRFRVKANITRVAADDLVRELTELGARCTIEDATTGAAAPPRTGNPPLPAPLPTASASASTASPQFQSGLSAAFSGQLDATNLGALAGDDAPLSLASLDGEPEAAGRAASFAPPGSPPPLPPSPRTPAAAARSPLPPPTRGVAPPPMPTRGAPPAVAPVDMFAPPDAGEQELTFELAPEELERKAKQRASAPVITASSDSGPAAAAAHRAAAISVASAPIAAPSGLATTSKLGPLADPNMRFAAGIVLAILLGFIPAHVIASIRERAAYAAIDGKVTTIQNTADTAEDFAALDVMRADQLEHKRSERRGIAVSALLVWAIAGGGIAFGWFRRVPWERWEA